MSPKNAQDDVSFDEFAAGAWRKLHWTAYMLTGDRHLAEDLAQTALARAYARWPKLRHGDAFTYTRQILVNANVDRLRRTHIVEVLGTDAESSAPYPHHPDGLEQRDQLVHLLATLTARERKVVVLRYYFDLPEDEVATELSVTRGTVKSTASRALAKLRHDNADVKGVR